MKRLISICLILLCCSQISLSKKDNNVVDAKKKNVLFIAIDDFRLQAGVYGQSEMITPNIDKLGNEGVVFSKAYCNVPVCGASRSSLLSGLRPTATRFVSYYASKDKEAPNVSSLPKHFKDNGYTTISLGKIYHHTNDDLGAWSEKPWDGVVKEQTWRDYVVKENIDLQNGKETSGPSFECAEVDDNAYRDGRFTDKAIEKLKGFKKSDEPFFLAVGFVKPHLPFNAPKKYWDLYKEEDIKLVDNPNMPEGAPKQASHTWGELRAYSDIPAKGKVSDEKARQLIHGYNACVSYTDAQIGKILSELESLGLDENTIVVLWGDHGWHLGEHGLWCKHCNFDRVLNAPLIVKSPGKTAGAKTETLVEFIDIYPTLCDLAEIEQPKHLHGKSLVPVLNNPEKIHKEAVFSRYHDGESVITKDFVYTKWVKNGKQTAQMLYDHKNDPAENINVAEKSEYKSVVKKMSKLIDTMTKEL